MAYGNRRRGTNRTSRQQAGTHKASRTRAKSRPSITTTAGMKAYQRRKKR